MSEELEKARLIKEALKIVDELAKIDDEHDLTDIEDGDLYDDLENLVKRANKLKKNPLWKLN